MLRQRQRKPILPDHDNSSSTDRKNRRRRKKRKNEQNEMRKRFWITLFFVLLFMCCCLAVKFYVAGGAEKKETYQNDESKRSLFQKSTKWGKALRGMGENESNKNIGSGDIDDRAFFKNLVKKSADYTAADENYFKNINSKKDIKLPPSQSDRNNTTTVECPDGSTGILNDDYCDCFDGSDEPHTSACSNILIQQKTFVCKDGSRKIYPSRVGDGIRDCKDGSDEEEVGGF
mmetsp:Transcript_5514/g.8142  ORF Transcript_5514/g.8142 Transcript_5514/m.8142 type:complete len:231 (+) Transcript_5514:127-819(+)